MELLDLIDGALTELLGAAKVSRRADGVLIVAGSGEAFAVQALTIEAPQEANPLEFGEDLVEFIRSRSQRAPDNDRDQVPTGADRERLTEREHGTLADTIERERDA
jgi:hypothetical protein